MRRHAVFEGIQVAVDAVQRDAVHAGALCKHTSTWEGSAQAGPTQRLVRIGKSLLAGGHRTSAAWETSKTSKNECGFIRAPQHARDMRLHCVNCRQTAQHGAGKHMISCIGGHSGAIAVIRHALMVSCPAETTLETGNCIPQPLHSLWGATSGTYLPARRHHGHAAPLK